MPTTPKRGKLIQVMPSGATVNLVENKTWAELQQARKRFIQRGYNANTLKVTYLNDFKKHEQNIKR